MLVFDFFLSNGASVNDGLQFRDLLASTQGEDRGEVLQLYESRVTKLEQEMEVVLMSFLPFPSCFHAKQLSSCFLIGW